MGCVQLCLKAGESINKVYPPAETGRQRPCPSPRLHFTRMALEPLRKGPPESWAAQRQREDSQSNRVNEIVITLHSQQHCKKPTLILVGLEW